MSSVATNKRIEIIDGFRGIAVLSVIFFHFYYRFGPPVNAVNWYPFEPVVFFEFGSYGMQLFFVISGFVIYQSLEASSSFGYFILKRLIRLFPSMLLCAGLTYIFMLLFDNGHKFSHNPLNFLFSVSFMHPDIWNFLLHRTDITYMDGAYWSLWAEIVFYVAAATIFFSFRKGSFLKHWLIITVVLQLLRIISSPRLSYLYPDELIYVLNGYYELFLFFNISQWIYFSLGIIFYSLYKGEKISNMEKGAAIMLVAFELFFLKVMLLRLMFLIVIGLFLTFIYRRHWLSVLKNKWLLMIGVISYPLYLLHENVGVIMIDRMANVLRLPIAGLLLPLIAMVFMIAFCYGIYRFYEKPVIKYLKSLFLPLH